MMDVFDQPPRTFDPTLLSERTTALRDNQAAPLPNEGQARKARIERLQKEMSLIQAFVTDCGRLAYAIQSMEMELEYPDARNMVLANIDQMKKKAMAKSQEVFKELTFLRALK